MRRVHTFLVLILVLLPSIVFGNTGKGNSVIKGIVKDANTNEALIGATVIIQETTLGAVSGLDGDFIIKNVPAGKHTLRFSAIGYKNITKIVETSPNNTEVVNVSLTQGSIMGSEIVVSASRYEQKKAEVPITTSILNLKTLNAEPIKQLDQILETVPGVDLVRSGGYGSSSVQIRGSNSFAGGGLGTRVLLLYDGYPLNSPDAGSVYWSMVSMDAVERIEVVKGSSSALYGAGAMGGVVQAVAALPKEFTLKAKFTNGFYDTPPKDEVNTEIYPGDKTPYFYKAEVSHSNVLGNLAYNIMYAHAKDDGYRQSAQMESDDIKLKARYTLSGNQYLQLTGVLTYVTGGIPYPWRNEYNALADPIAGNYQYDDLKDNSMQMFGLKHVWTISNTSSLESRIFFNRAAFLIMYYPEYNSAFDVKDGSGNVIGNYQQYSAGKRSVYDPDDPSTYNDSDARRYGGGIQFNWFSHGHRLTTGFDVQYDDVTSTMYYDNTAQAFGLFAQDDFKLSEKIRLSFGARFDLDHVDRSEITYTDFLNPTGVDPVTYEPLYSEKTGSIKYQTLSQFSPRAAVTYLLNAETSFRASFGQSMRAPTLAERFVTEAGFFRGLPNTELKAERMTSLEIGMFKSFGRYFSIDLSTYYNLYKDLIESENVNEDALASDVSSIIFQYKNVSKARIIGFEASLNAQPIDDLNLTFGYNYMNAKDISSNSDRRLGGNLNPEEDKDWLSYRPEHAFNFRASYSFNKADISFTGRYISRIKTVRMYANPDGTEYPGNFFVMNTSAKYNVFDVVTLSAAIKNIGNVQYEELEHYRAPGRSFHFGIEYAY